MIRLPGILVKKIVLPVMAGVMITAGCGKSVTDNPSEVTPEAVKKEAVPSPVELNVFVSTAEADPQAFFMEWYGKYIQKKYPNLSFRVYKSDKGTTLPELIAAGVNIDLMHGLADLGVMMKEFGLLTDISSLLQTHGFDLNRIEPTALSALKNVNDGKLPGLPIELNSYAFYYNKDLFDKFGVVYPKDNLTWDDVIELNKKLTRFEGGQQYYGFGTTGSLLFMDNQLSLPLDDPKTYKAAFNTDAWNKYLQKFIPLLQVPGYEKGFNATTNAYSMLFAGVLNLIKDKNVAMWAGLSQDYPRSAWGGTTNWAVTKFPTMPEKPGVGPQPRTTNMFVTSTSRHKDEAFLAISAFLSDEVQTSVVAERAIGTPLKNSKVREVFGRDNPDLAGRNAKFLQPDQYAEPIVQTPNTINAKNEINRAFVLAAAGVKDLNTALREAEENVNKRAETLKNQ
ncbi:ABC transporter substrate-binding protein [Paenibacillus sp. GYB003]|uniref:ABC transporter substrate-binding protein n=1 Tax=Paenibacillus sp. GYB003 TaxID=2994392 RepID=UPI002F965E4C